MGSLLFANRMAAGIKNPDYCIDVAVEIDEEEGSFFTSCKESSFFLLRKREEQNSSKSQIDNNEKRMGQRND